MKNGMCRAGGMCEVEEKCIQDFSRETMRKETTWKAQDRWWWSGLMWLWIGGYFVMKKIAHI
jgi:hypothetical protein